MSTFCCGSTSAKKINSSETWNRRITNSTKAWKYRRETSMKTLKTWPSRMNTHLKWAKGSRTESASAIECQCRLSPLRHQRWMKNLNITLSQGLLPSNILRAFNQRLCNLRGSSTSLQWHRIWTRNSRFSLPNSAKQSKRLTSRSLRGWSLPHAFYSQHLPSQWRNLHANLTAEEALQQIISRLIKKVFHSPITWIRWKTLKR